MFDSIVRGDVRFVESLFSGSGIIFDVVLWWHGPEHIDKWELGLTLEALESKTNKMVILGCPFGKYPQDAVDGNIFEIHRSALYPEDFIKYGYNVKTIGERDVMGGNLLAWKKY